MAENTLEGTARKRGQYRGAWRARYFVLNAAQSRLDYWESREDKENKQKPRGSIKVRGAAPLDVVGDGREHVAGLCFAVGRLERAEARDQVREDSLPRHGRDIAEI